MSHDSSRPPLAEDHVYLLGRAGLTDCLNFMSTQRVDAAPGDVESLTAQWRAAHDHLQTLEQPEAAWADNPQVRPLPPALARKLPEVVANPIFRRAFSFVPVEIGWVELDRLTVTQKTINLTHVRRLQEQIGSAPDDEQVFGICLPHEHQIAGHRLARIPNGFVFISEANDLRFLESVCLGPGQVANYSAVGPLAGVIGLVVGYSCNYLNVVAVENRLVLNNGYHRAYALRELGVTHVPCVIQKVTRREELEVVGTGALRRTPDLYLQERRPPVFKDFFEPKLRKIVSVTPKARQVRITFTIEELSVPKV